jgi:hypothetical protein
VFPFVALGTFFAGSVFFADAFVFVEEGFEGVVVGIGVADSFGADGATEGRGAG